MEITDVKIRKICRDERLRAIVSVVIDGELAVHDIKVIEGPNRLFVAMPSRKEGSERFRDVVHPITAEGRKMLENIILEKYLNLVAVMAEYGENKLP